MFSVLLLLQQKKEQRNRAAEGDGAGNGTTKGDDGTSEVVKDMRDFLLLADYGCT